MSFTSFKARDEVALRESIIKPLSIGLNLKEDSKWKKIAIIVVQVALRAFSSYLIFTRFNYPANVFLSLIPFLFNVKIEQENDMPIVVIKTTF